MVTKVQTAVATASLRVVGNQDGGLSANDAQLAFMIVLGTYSPTPTEDCAADCDGNDIVTAADAQKIFLTVLGMDSCVEPVRTEKRLSGPQPRN